MMSPRRIYCCPVHRDMRKIGLGSCPKCDATLLPEGSSYAVIQRVVQDPLALLNLVGWAILAMSVVALIATRG